MSLLLDTNVLSEATAKAPRVDVIAWMEAQPSWSVYVSVVSIGEIDFGIARLPVGARRTALQRWRDQIVQDRARRLLGIDLRICEAWAAIRAKAAAARRTMPVLDAFIAATAEVHGLTVVTRNIKDFKAWGGSVLNPWPEAIPR